MADQVVHETEAATKKILQHWYGSMVNDWRITPQTVAATAELLGATNQCNSVFKFVPKPSGAFSGVGTMGSMAFSYAKDSVKRAATDNSYYNSCIVSQARNRRSDIQETTVY